MFALTVSHQTPPTLDFLEIAAPKCPRGGAVVKMTACGLCGSDVDKLLHRTPASGTVLGHEAVGILEEIDPHVSLQTGFKQNQRVVVAHHVPCGQCRFCRGGSESMCDAFKGSNFTPGGWAQQFALTPEHLCHTTFAIPEKVTDFAAHAVEPLACVLKAIDKAFALLPQTENALVIGLGFVGLLATQALQARSVQTAGVDLLPSRRAFSTHHGLCAHVGPPEATLPQLSLPEDGADIVFLSVVSQPALNLALERVRNGGMIVLFASPPAVQQVQLDPYPLYFREIQVLSSYSPSLASLQQAAEMIFSGHIQTDVLVTHTMPLAEAMAGLTAYRQGEAIKVVFTAEK
ncbi:MAG: alcohol dehydrogenase catalytic domain-containing protein [Vampirovibrionales bacterium]|nr:alcohol dehydrogenase catalytic domain-containing protein [Vampirovibrionales bacterium]